MNTRGSCDDAGEQVGGEIPKNYVTSSTRMRVNEAAVPNRAQVWFSLREEAKKLTEERREREIERGVVVMADEATHREHEMDALMQASLGDESEDHVSLYNACVL